VLAPVFFILSCVSSSNKENIEKWKTEVVEVEKNFNDMAQQEGIVKAFATYAAKDGVIKRNGKLVMGQEAIVTWYQNDSNPNEILIWKPDYVDVSNSGDLAYTYGSYILTTIDSTGTRKEKTGSFHTVWKRQDDGSWKFVWD
jgi:ketosteroid isomerase-like protein